MNIYKVTSKNAIYFDSYEILNVEAYSDKLKHTQLKIINESGFATLEIANNSFVYLVYVDYLLDQHTVISKIMYNRLKLATIIFVRDKKLNELL